MNSSIIPLHLNIVPNSNVSDDELIARSGHRIVIDDTHMYCWGGYNAEYWGVENTQETEYPLLKELWRYSLWTKTWTKLPTHGDVPTELASHTIIKVGNHLLHFGGTGVPFGQATTNQLYDLDLTTLEWRRVGEDKTDAERDDPETAFNDGDGDNEHIEDTPRPKYGHTMTRVGQYAYVIGGTSGYTYDLNIHRLDLQTLTWKYIPVNSKYVPEQRYRHEVVHHDGMLFMLGGGTGITVHNVDKIDMFNIEERNWYPIQTKPHINPDTEIMEFPPGRRCHSCSKYKDSLFLCGGLAGTTIMSDIWRLHLPTYQWTKLDVPLLKPVYFHASDISPDGHLYVFGGVVEVDVVRTNTLQSVWLDIPSLKIQCWNTLLRMLDIEQCKTKRTDLLNIGVPMHLLETIL